MLIDLTVPRSPLELAAMFDRLRAAPVGDVFAALGMPGVEIMHSAGRVVAYAGDGPNALDLTYARAPMTSPYERSRTDIRIDADYAEGRALAAMLTAALQA